MKIGVSGTSGNLGRAIVAELVARGGGHDVVAISRSPGGVGGGIAARAGDYDDPASLMEAYAGLDRLLLIPGNDLRPGVRGAQLRTAIDAAVAAGVDHIVLVSAVGARKLADADVAAAYWIAEQHLMRKAPRWTVVRMSYFAESMADEIRMSQGQGVLAGLGDERVAYVSREDVAAAAAGALLGDDHAGAIYSATGPAAVSGEERAAIVSEVLGTRIGFVAVTQEQLRAGLAAADLPPPVVDVVVGIKQDFVDGKFDIVTGDVRRLSGRTPRSLRDVLVQSLA